MINLQYCAACMQIFTKEVNAALHTCIHTCIHLVSHSLILSYIQKIRGMKHLAVHVVDAMVLLLQSSDNIIQFYVITTCGDIFLNNLW